MKRYFIIGLFFLATHTIFAQCIDEIGFYEVNGTFSLASKGQYMVLSSGAIIDNSNPINPSLVGQFSFNGFASSIVIDGNYAYFGTGMDNNLYIADISVISFPVAKGSIDFGIGNGVFGMAIQNETLFAALGGDGILLSIDVSDKSSPQILDTLYFAGGQCRDVAVEGNFAFAAAESGLKIIDITGPSNMVAITSIGSGYNSIALGDNFAFMGKSAGGVDVYDISNASNPTPVFAILNQSGTAWDLAYRNNLLYLATDFGGLFIYKIWNNMAEEMANFQRSGNGQSFGVSLQDSLVLLPGLVEGVSLLMYDSAGFVGIKKDFSKNELVLFPNPSKQYINVESGSIIEMEIFNIEGKMVYSGKVKYPNTQIDISNFGPGKYIVRAKTENKILTKPFIKIE